MGGRYLVILCWFIAFNTTDIVIKWCIADDESTCASSEPAPVLIRGTFGFRESEWNGLSDPSSTVQEPSINQVDLVESWTNELEGEVASQNYNIGPPPAGMPGGCWVDGNIYQRISAKPTQRGESMEFKYTVEHDGSYYCFCGVNIHWWSTHSDLEFFVRGPIGTRYAISGKVRGGEQLTGSDGSFNHDAVVDGESHVPEDQFLVQKKRYSTGPEVEVNGVTYSRAFEIDCDGDHVFAYSHIIQCPFIPWHTSNASVSIELEIAPVYETPQIRFYVREGIPGHAWVEF